MTRFLLLAVTLAALTTWRSVLLWKGKVSLFTDANLIQGTSLYRTLRRFQASVPSIALSFWLLIPSAIATHYFDIERNATIKDWLGIIQWPSWILCGAFFVMSITIQFVGGPMRMIPPAMRSGKRLE